MSKLDELDIVIRQKNGRTVATIPQLKLYATADTIDGALATLEARKKALVADLEAAGELESLQFDEYPVGVSARRYTTGIARDLGLFALKTGLVLVAIIAAIVVSATLIQSEVNETIANTKIGGHQFWTKIESNLDQMARPESDLPPAQKQRLLADIRTIGLKWRPFIVELRSALDGSDSSTPNSPAGR